MSRKKIFSISKKLIILLVTLTILPTTLLGLTSFIISSRITESEIRNAAEGSIGIIEENINTFMRMNEENLLVLGQNANIRDIFNKKPEEVKYVHDVLEGYLKGHKDIMSIYVGRKDKKIELFPKQKLPEDFDPTKRPWYTAAEGKNQVIWTEPYKDTGTGKMTVTLAISVYDFNNEFVGVLGADISLEKLTSFIGKANIGKNGYVSLLDSKGNILTHPDTALVGKELPVQDLKQAIYETAKGNKDYKYKNSSKCAYFMTVGASGWKLMGIFDYHEILDRTNQILVTCLISGLLIVITAIILGIFASRPITRSIKILSEDMKKIGDGDLSIRVMIRSNDEIGLLGKNLNNMVEQLGKLMKNVQDTAIQVSASADNLAASSEETTASTEEISRTVFEISNATADQAQNTEYGLNRTTELAQNIQGVSEAIDTITGMVDKSNTLNQKGLSTIKVLKEKSDENNLAAAKVESAIGQVDKSSEQIGQIISTIGNIASQTNLLALNASIEAARAGEAGRGFSVVAEEIRKLAEQSALATRDIQQLIKDIQNQSKDAVGSIELAKPIVEAQSNAVNATRAIFEDISSTIDKLSKEVYAITQLNRNMLEKKDGILSIMENISASAEQTSASTEQVAASAQQQLAGIQEVARTAEQLNLLAENLSSEIEKFKI